MFVMNNAWLATKRHPWRAGLTAAAALIVSFGTMVTLAIVQANDTAHGSQYEQQQPTIAIRPDSKTSATYDGTDSSYTKYYQSWDDFNGYVSQAQQADITFQQTAGGNGALDYTMSETMPVRQTDSITAIPGSDDQSADKTGGELQLRAFNTVQAAQQNDWGRYKVVKGKHLSYSHGAKGVLISQELADKNKLEVGDTFKVGMPNDASKTVELTVRGIYQYDQKAQGGDAKLAKDNRLNAIYTTYYLFATNNLESGADDKNAGWAVPDLDIRVKAASPEDYQAFVKNFDKKLADGLEITSPSLEAYERSIQPVTDAAGKAHVAQWTLLGVGGAALLALTIGCAWIGRRNEIANGLIIGASKGRLGWQLTLESMMMTIPALAVGVAAGALGAAPMASALAGGYDVTMAGSIVTPVIGYGIAAVLLFAFIALLSAATFDTKKLFDAPELSEPTKATEEQA